MYMVPPEDIIRRVLRIPEPGFVTIYCRQVIDNVAELLTDMHAQKGQGLLGLEREHENV